MDDTFRRGPMLLLAGRANRPLAEAVAAGTGMPLGALTIHNFADGEIFVRIDENARGSDVFILQPTPPPAENIMELLLLIDAARRASAARVTAVVPYYGYARQDRKDQPRVAIGARLMADLIIAAGAERLLGIDFHSHQVQGFFDIPVDHLYAAPVLTKYFREKKLQNLVVVAPDVGAAKMARGFAKRLGTSFAIIDKRRPAPNVAEALHVVGEVEGMTCLVADDMIDTGGTMASVIHTLERQGAREIYACATHALLSRDAPKLLADSPVREVVVTDTVHVEESRRFPQLKILSVAELLARAIRYIHLNESVSQLFEASFDDTGAEGSVRASAEAEVSSDPDCRGRSGRQRSRSPAQGDGSQRERSAVEAEAKSKGRKGRSMKEHGA